MRKLHGLANRVLHWFGLCLVSERNAEHEHVRWRIMREPKWTPYTGND